MFHYTSVQSDIFQQWVVKSIYLCLTSIPCYRMEWDGVGGRGQDRLEQSRREQSRIDLSNGVIYSHTHTNTLTWLWVLEFGLIPFSYYSQHLGKSLKASALVPWKPQPLWFCRVVNFQSGAVLGTPCAGWHHFPSPTWKHSSSRMLCSLLFRKNSNSFFFNNWKWVMDIDS